MPRSWEFFSYFFTFWVTPMFVFSGVFFGVDRFPGLRPADRLDPADDPLIEVVRPLAAGQELAARRRSATSATSSRSAAVAFGLAYRRLRIRLFD